MKKLWRGQRGFTLLELLVSVGILSMVMGSIGTTLFQSMGTGKVVVDDGIAINELRTGLAYFAGDVKMAQVTDLVDGGEPASSCTLSWTDEFGDAGVSHTSSYALIEDRLVRTYDGNAHTVARRVVSVSFFRFGQTITIQLEVNAAAGITRTQSVKTVMRSESP